MKKLTVLSVVVASLLLVGCNEDSSNEKKVEAIKTEVVAKAPVKEETATISEKATKAVDAVKNVASSAVAKTAEAKDAVAQKATEAVESTKKAANAVVAKTTEMAHDAKEAVSETVKDAKDAVAKKVDEAKDAVAKATTEAPAVYMACAGCHGKDGKLKALGKSAIIAGQAKADIVTKLNGYKAGTLNTTGMGSLMKGQASKLSDADIETLATYISGLK